MTATVTPAYDDWKRARATVPRLDLTFAAAHPFNLADAILGLSGATEDWFHLSSIFHHWRMTFWAQNMAVLESIRFRGAWMRQFKEDCERKAAGCGSGLPLLPSTEHIRVEAQQLLTEYAENPVPDLADLFAPQGLLLG